MRNIKLRHSRIVMYAGLLFVILNASKKQYYLEKEKYIKSMVCYTPVERISLIMRENGQDPQPFLLCYDYFIGLINQSEVRKNLVSLEYANRQNNPLFRMLSQNSAVLFDILTEFIFNMRGVWSDKALGYLLF